MLVFLHEALQYLILLMLVDTLIFYNMFFLYQHYVVDGLIVSDINQRLYSTRIKTMDFFHGFRPPKNRIVKWMFCVHETRLAPVEIHQIPKDYRIFVMFCFRINWCFA